MRSLVQVTVAVLLVGCVWPVVADTEEAARRVTLTAEDTPAAEVAAAIQEQTKVQVAVTERTVAEVSGTMTELGLDAAVAGLAVAIPGSYLKAFAIEEAPPEEPYTAEELIQALNDARDWWMQSMSDEERQALFTTWREQREQQRDQQQGARGGGDQQGQDRRRLEDPLRRLELPVQHETISIDLEIAGPAEAVSTFITASGYLLLVEPHLEGAVTFSMQEAPIADVLDGIAESIGGKWRPIYIVSQPYELTEEEREQRAEARFNQRWADYWAQSPAERATSLQERIGRIERMMEWMNNPEGEGRRRGRFARFLPRIMERTTQYSLSLSVQQRLEIKPYLQALAKAANSVQGQ